MEVLFEHYYTRYLNLVVLSLDQLRSFCLVVKTLQGHWMAQCEDQSVTNGLRFIFLSMFDSKVKQLSSANWKFIVANRDLVGGYMYVLTLNFEILHVAYF